MRGLAPVVHAVDATLNSTYAMRRVRATPWFVTVLMLALGAGCAGYGHGSTATGPRQRSIDELAGSYKGVALGDPRSAAIRVFGKPAETTGSSTPLGSGFTDGGPLIQRNPPGYDEKPDELRYENVAFLSTPTPAGIHSIVIDDPRAATQKGVGIGDPLAAARKAYPTLRCQKGHDLGESYMPAHCSGKLADGRYIWFGNDPIRVIALSPTSMG
jgi:hypothetical protein